MVTVAGLISGLQRKITKQGSPWAIVTLEDLEGVIDVMVFPQTYQLVATQLIEDAVVVVRGKIDKREDQPKLIATELTLPDLSEGPRGPVVITLPVARCVPPVVDRLKEVLATHPGVTEVHLQLLSGGRTTLMRLDDRLRVAPGPALYGDLKALLGPGSVA
jgi:DNA polymerase III subunit alpha